MLILIDQDNVLADFERGFRDAWLACGHHQPLLAPEARKNFHLIEDYPAHLSGHIEAIYTTPGFFRGLPLVAGAVQALDALLCAGHDIRICTSPLQNYRHCVAEKYEWVERNLGAEFVQRVIMTRDKTLVHGDFLIDDKPEVTGARRPDWRHIIFDQPYNRHVGKPRMTWESWSDALQIRDDPVPAFR